MFKLSRCKFRHASCSLSRRFSVHADVSNFLDYHPEVEAALHAKKPVVALETALVTNGLPQPENIDVANQLERIVRAAGVVPATIGILNGRIKIGLSSQEIERLGSSTNAIKVSRRDIAPVLVKQADGGTTCSATLIFAALAGIKVFSTGGLGGVHRGGETSLDVSADLMELSRCPVALVSSGIKSILDIGRTLEVLETLGVPVFTYGSSDEFPAFFTRKSGIRAPWKVDNPEEAARIIYMQDQLKLTNGALFAVPIPEKDQADGQLIQAAIEQAISESEANGVSKRGKEATPWLLSRIAQLTDGHSIKSNVALLKNAATVASQIAVHYNHMSQATSIAPAPTKYFPSTPSETQRPADVLVFGAACVDVTAQATVEISPQSTAPGSIEIAAGGVGRNIAEAAHRLSSSRDSVALIAPIGDDSFGDLLTRDLLGKGMRVDGLIPQSRRTAVCNMILNAAGGLELGVVDMEILDAWSTINLAREEDKPKMIILDANPSHSLIESVLCYSHVHNIPALYEPTSIPKSQKIFGPLSRIVDSLEDDRFPIGFTTPNLMELKAMYGAVNELGLSSHPKWWRLINGLSLNAQFRNELEALSRKPVRESQLSSHSLAFITDEGAATMAIRLLPFFQHIVVKLGDKGVLTAMYISRSTDSIWHSKQTWGRCIVHRGTNGTLIIKHSPPLEPESVVSVTGCGDSFVGAIVAKMIQESGNPFLFPAKLDEVLDIGQRAAIRSLSSRSAVSPELSSLRM